MSIKVVNALNPDQNSPFRWITRVTYTDANGKEITRNIATQHSYSVNDFVQAPRNQTANQSTGSTEAITDGYYAFKGVDKQTRLINLGTPLEGSADLLVQGTKAVPTADFEKDLANSATNTSNTSMKTPSEEGLAASGAVNTAVASSVSVPNVETTNTIQATQRKSTTGKQERRSSSTPSQNPIRTGFTEIGSNLRNIAKDIVTA